MSNSTVFDINCHLLTLASNKQVVNGFFWAGKPVTNHNKEASHSTALGVSCCNYLIVFDIFCHDLYCKVKLSVRC